MTAGTTTGTTTEATTTGTTDAPGRRFTFSVRSRITASVAVLAASAMVLVGLLVHGLGVSSMHRDEATDIEREFEEFRKLQTEGVDPITNRPFTVPGVLTRFLQRNVPDDDEVLVTYVGTRAVELSAGGDKASEDGQGFLRLPAYREALEAVRTEGGTRRFEDETYGEAWVSSLPVRSRAAGREDGALVIVSFFREDRAELAGTIRSYALASAAALLLVTLLAWFQAGRLLAPVRLLTGTTERIGATDLARRIPERGNDDITALTRTINQMLARLQSGFEAQRRFLDDAGHELRTPLTVVRGHLELLDPDDPAEVAETRDLVLEETDRMSRLVDDLILLAKSRRPDFVSPVTTDVAVLTRAVHAKARALGEREWALDAVADGTAVLDEQRLTQALLQLVDNAVKHTDEGATVAIGSARAPGLLQLWVRDTGDGIPEEDRSRIFDRFARSTARPGDEGFGLGLSIVQAIVTAHGGSIALDSEPGEGTTFTLTLPVEEDRWHTS